MKKPTYEEVYKFIVARNPWSDDSVTLALRKEFAFSSKTTYLDVKDLVQITRKWTGWK
ncbi:hypothetical protein LCGC14_1145130 [marine sediment metagenome]|uniref:Uncharacterized protein n=1 Tax=marine sediment metagenome TaxID=412755 RepID=A0A0F9Q2R5_9ZZZZ